MNTDGIKAKDRLSPTSFPVWVQVYADGAQNQYPGEVEFYQRKHNALKAYTEWMPIRWNFTATPSINAYTDYAINRTLQFGRRIASAY